MTHLLTGACLGRSGCNRITAYATLTMVLAAEAPDIDVLWNLGGPVTGFAHHRGMTHTFLGAPLMALLVTGAVWLWHRWRTRGGGRTDVSTAKPPGELSVRWGWIWVLALLADLSHLLLDWTNNYGVRPFFPFNPRWYAGNIFFIVEPVLFGALLLALVMPAILGLADREIGVRRPMFRGRGWAIFALCVAVVLGCWRWAEHERALHLLAAQNYRNEAPLRMTVSPYPGDPFQWFGVVETKDFYQTAILNSRTEDLSRPTAANIYYKPPRTPALLAAKNSRLGRVFLDWSQFPFVEEAGVSGLQKNGAHATEVRFEDLRFAYNALFLHGRADNPLGGTVTVGPNGKILAMRMGGRLQR